MGAAFVAPSQASVSRVPAPGGRPRSAVARWKRQLLWFAAFVTGLLVLVAAGSAGAMWGVISEVARAQAADEIRSRVAVDARIAVVEVERLLAQTVAEEDAGKVRIAAVASIAAASRLEDAVTALREALPGNGDVVQMSELVDSVKGPRVKVMVLARQGARAEALAAREAIAEPLKRIDAASAAILQEQAEARGRATLERTALFQRMLGGLLLAGLLGAGAGLFFYRRLMRRFAPVEQLLVEVAHSAHELDAGAAGWTA